MSQEPTPDSFEGVWNSSCAVPPSGYLKRRMIRPLVFQPIDLFDLEDPMGQTEK